MGIDEMQGGFTNLDVTHGPDPGSSPRLACSALMCASRFEFLNQLHYHHIYVSMYLCIYVSMYLCIYVSMYLCIYLYLTLSVYLSIYLSIYTYMRVYCLEVWGSEMRTSQLTCVGEVEGSMTNIMMIDSGGVG